VRIQVASDLHHEMAPAGSALAAPLTIAPHVDLLVLAGDVHSGTKGVELYADSRVPVAYVHGNHEAFGHEYPSIVDEMKARADGTPVRVLQNDEWIYHGVRFLGSSLWTDYFGFPLSLEDALNSARKAMADHKKIRRSGGRTFRPKDALEHQRQSLRWLYQKLDIPFDGPTVVVTHHAPSGLAIPQRNRTHELTPAYASNVELLVLKATLWVHGHIHESSDYRIGECRVICNPRGRPGRDRKYPEIPYENAAFQPTLTVDV
jgi:Icc-related predicted phosphoesterase